MPPLSEHILYSGDCLLILPQLASDFIDACVTDPPYGLKFMGKAWDHGVPGVPYWKEVYRVLKPGAHLLAFCGTRTYHHLASSIENAGFEIRDVIMWVYGQGFPKSRSLKDICRPELGTALKPSVEIICLARKKLSGKTVAENVLMHGTGALNIDACRVPIVGDRRDPCGADGVQHRTTGNTYGEHKPNDGFDLSKARWPANLVHDGSDEVLAAFPVSDHARGNKTPTKRRVPGWFTGAVGEGPIDPGDCGSAARFFYCAKADKQDRIDSKHPTVKPIKLLMWLVRLVTPPGGLVLDPFAGTGTTAAAAHHEGMRSISIENDPSSQADIRRRMQLLSVSPNESIPEQAPDENASAAAYQYSFGEF